MITAATTCRNGFGVALAAALTLLGHSPALAGTIGFRTDASVTTGPGINLKVTLTQTGDEEAISVSVAAELLDRKVEGETVPLIGPGRAHDWNLHLADEIENGVYVVVLRARYTDTNGYPFEVVSTADAVVRSGIAPRHSGSFNVTRVPVDGESTGHLTVKRPAGRSGEADVRLVVPVGIAVDPESLHIRFPASGKAVADFQVTNRKLLAGTSVNIFALVTGAGASGPQVDSIRGSVTIGPRVQVVNAALFYRAAAAVFTLLVLLEIAAWLRTRQGLGH